MRIRIIGCGSMWTKYNSACYQIDNNIMVDFPNGACKYLYRLNIVPSSIDHILITHFHGDHFFDLPFYILNKSKSKSKNINIYCSKDGKNKIKTIGELAFPNSFKDACNETDIKFNYDNNFKIGDYEITKLEMEHGRMKPAYGYLLKNKDSYVGFTGDTSLCANVELMASKCECLFCDCMFEKGNKKHQGIDNLEYLASKYPKCNFIVTHLMDETRNKLKDNHPNNIIIPEDGDFLEIVLDK